MLHRMSGRRKKTDCGCARRKKEESHAVGSDPDPWVESGAMEAIVLAIVVGKGLH